MSDSTPTRNAPSRKTLEAQARRAAARRGWIARKSRASIGMDNRGGFALIDPYTNTILFGEKFDLSVEEVIELCGEGGQA